MFQAATVMGAIAAYADQEQTKALSEFGLNLGLAFQIADDLLDINSTSEQLGKTAGKDQQAGKLTYPALLGIEKAKELEKQIAAKANNALETLGAKANILRQLTTELLERKK